MQGLQQREVGLLNLLLRAHELKRYGLALPAYAHCTSPIRRYPDLVNQRQQLSWIRKERAPNTHAELQRVAEHANKTLRDREDARGMAFKKHVIDRAASGVIHGRYETLNQAGFHQAVKIVIEAGDWPFGFEEEIIRRIAADRLSNKSLAAILFADQLRISKAATTRLHEALATNPARALSLLNEARQTGLISEFTCECVPIGSVSMPRFSAELRAVVNEALLTSSASGGAKKDAEQLAAVKLLGQVCGIGIEKPISEAAARM